jgi:FtsZ-binding cell division protein ZapB
MLKKLGNRMYDFIAGKRIETKTVVGYSAKQVDEKLNNLSEHYLNEISRVLDIRQKEITHHLAKNLNKKFKKEIRNRTLYINRIGNNLTECIDKILLEIDNLKEFRNNIAHLENSSHGRDCSREDGQGQVIDHKEERQERIRRLQAQL